MKSIDIVVEGPVAQAARQYAMAVVSSSLSNHLKILTADVAAVTQQRRKIRRLSKWIKAVLTFFRIQIDAPEHLSRPQPVLITQDELQKAIEALDEKNRVYETMKKDGRWARLAGRVNPSVTIDSVHFLHDPVEAKGKVPGFDHVVCEFLSQARRSLTIVSPYLILTPDVRLALRRAISRGVRVVVYTNSLTSTDNRTVQMAYEYRFCEMASLGDIEILEYSGPETLHAKFLIRDEQWCLVMAYNLDWRSKLKNLETGVRFSSAEIASHLMSWLSSHSSQFQLVAGHGRIFKKTMRAYWPPSELFRRLMTRLIERQL
jgi:phosphatidylserine/phosphatidylglycerophosphate/cardiolipin synthase-like enzyme